MSVSHFSRDPRAVSPFSRGPKPSPPVLAGGGTTPAPAVVEESPSGRRFGEVLVEEMIITAAQLETALRLQAASRTYVPLGQVLLAKKFITRKQLNSLLHRHRKRSRLGEILVKAGSITRDQLHEALVFQRKRPMPIGQALIQLGYLTESRMRDALCTQLHINFFDLDPIVIDRALARLISERFAVRHLLVPLFRAGDTLVVAMDDPSQAEFIERLQFDLRLHVEVVTTLTQKLKAAMARLYGSAAPADVDVFGRRNIVIGSIRDHVVAELAEKTLRGVSVVAHAW
jgi:Type II secretion system (T2SS), protein E, N-terminal domain